MAFVVLLIPVPGALLLKELSNTTFNDGAMLTQNAIIQPEKAKVLSIRETEVN